MELQSSRRVSRHSGEGAVSAQARDVHRARIISTKLLCVTVRPWVGRGRIPLLLTVKIGLIASKALAIVFAPNLSPILLFSEKLHFAMVRQRAQQMIFQRRGMLDLRKWKGDFEYFIQIGLMYEITLLQQTKIHLSDNDLQKTTDPSSWKSLRRWLPPTMMLR